MSNQKTLLGSNLPSSVAGDARIEFGEFLMTIPPLESRRVSAGVTRGQYRFNLKNPAIELHCEGPKCGGARFFDPMDNTVDLEQSDKASGAKLIFLRYTCRNCEGSAKTYAISFKYQQVEFGKFESEAMKIGEHPRFGEPRPNAIKDVLDDEIEFFERGYRAETDGLGIGAFAYYRRFVEGHKDKMIDEIMKVAKAQGAKPDIIAALEEARKSVSFDKAVDLVKNAIPDSLRYHGGHNPLTLLHTALSQGLHNDDDVECLVLAQDIRLVLTDLAERSTLALKSSSELGDAVKRLLNKGARGKRT
jgi:hypothetical protein